MEFELTEKRAPAMNVDGTEVILSIAMGKPEAFLFREAQVIYGVYIYHPTTAPEELKDIRAGIVDNMLKLINIYYNEGYAQAALVYDANHGRMVYET